MPCVEQRRGDHEDDEQHQHHVDVRHDVDLAHQLAVACAGRHAQAPCGRVPLQDGRELFHEGVVAQLETAHLVGVAVVGDHRRDRGEQSHRSGDQRLGDAGRHHRERGLLHVTERMERVHDAPHRAEQADVRTGRADRRERREVLLEPVDLAQLRDAHGTLRTLEQLRGRDSRLLPQLAELAKARLEDGFHPRGRATPALHGTIQGREIAARPEGVLETIGPCARLADDAPACAG